MLSFFLEFSDENHFYKLIFLFALNINVILYLDASLIKTKINNSNNCNEKFMHIFLVITLLFV